MRSCLVSAETTLPNVVLVYSSDIKGGTKTERFENRVLRRIFGPKKDEVPGGWRKLHN
jgi:hypothetical protein